MGLADFQLPRFQSSTVAQIFQPYAHRTIPPVEALQQDRRIFLCFARWPAGHIVMFWSELQRSVLKVIDIIGFKCC